MHVVLVKFQVHPEQADSFRAAVLKHANNSLTNEPGCLQFDVSTDPDDATRFLLYEVYEDAAAFELHTQAAYLAEFGAKIEPWLVSRELTCWTRCDPA